MTALRRNDFSHLTGAVIVAALTAALFCKSFGEGSAPGYVVFPPKAGVFFPLSAQPVINPNNIKLTKNILFMMIDP
jgi:hypothetical protein